MLIIWIPFSPSMEEVGCTVQESAMWHNVVLRSSLGGPLIFNCEFLNGNRCSQTLDVIKETIGGQNGGGSWVEREG